MTRHGPALLALSVLAIAGWTYNVNYDTRAALDRLSELRAKIAEEREALQVLRVEWAWLNAPDRLTTLVSAHNERLGLIAMTPEALGHVAAVPYPPDIPTRPLPPVEAPEALMAAAPPAPGAGAAEMPAASPVESADTLLASADGDEMAGERTITAMPPPPRATAVRLARQIAGSPSSASTASSSARSKPEARPGAEPAVTLASAPATTSAMAPAAKQPGQPAPSATQKATVLTQRAQAPSPIQAPSSMQEAVAMALVEAGVLDASAAVAVIPASASGSMSGGTSARESRPAVWIGR